MIRYRCMSRWQADGAYSKSPSTSSARNQSSLTFLLSYLFLLLSSLQHFTHPTQAAEMCQLSDSESEGWKGWIAISCSSSFQPLPSSTSPVLSIPIIDSNPPQHMLTIFGINDARDNTPNESNIW